MSRDLPGRNAGNAGHLVGVQLQGVAGGEKSEELVLVPQAFPEGVFPQAGEFGGGAPVSPFPQFEQEDELGPGAGPPDRIQRPGPDQNLRVLG